MARLNVDEAAPDFSLEDYRGESFRLSEILRECAVLLVFNRGFV